MPKNRVLHARITDVTHEKLTRVCGELGCSITDYVLTVLDQSFDENPRDIEPDTIKEKRPEPMLRAVGKSIKVIPKFTNVSLSND